MLKNKKIAIALIVLIAVFFYSGLTLAELITPTSEQPADIDTQTMPELIATAESTLPEYSDTYYAGAETLNLNGHFLNDVIIIGNDITIDGIVNGDVLAAGSNITIKGEVNGNVRAAGANITIEANIKKNTTLFAGVIKIAKGANLEKDLITFGGTIAILGPVSGNLQAGGSEFTLNNIVGGNAKLGEMGRITLGDNAKILGDFEYAASSEQALTNIKSKVEGDIQKNEPELKVDKEKENKLTKYTKASFWLWSLIKLLSLLLVGLVFVNVCKEKTEQTIKKMYCCPWKNILFGLLATILTPFLCTLVMLTIVGFPLGLIALTVYAISLYIALVVIGAAIGKKILPASPSLVGPTFLGIIIVWLVKLIPYVGGIICLIAIFWAIGALLKPATKPVKKSKAKTNGKK